jgi:prepilin-type N-terminal cleavage/methylation domain-containing protein
MNNHPISNDRTCPAPLAAHAALGVPHPSPLAPRLSSLSSLIPRPSPLASRPSRRAFTLVELMVVMAIMAILAAAMALAVAGAQEAAQIAKTRSLIARLNALVMQKYESYRTRRLPIAIPGEVIDPASGNPIPTPPGVSRKVRCDVIRQMMRMEMPERWSDIYDGPIAITLEDPAVPPPRPTYKDPTNGQQSIFMSRPASSQAYLSYFNSINVTANTAFQNDPKAYEGAKCLYLLVTMGLDEPDVMENFSEGDIADFDHTGCKVFLDAWGNPIQFLRWAPGFTSPLQPLAPAGGSSAKDQRGTDQTDPTGIYRTLTPGGTFALYPLIYSAGPDGYYDTVSGPVHGGPVAPVEENLPPSGAVVLSYAKSTNPSNNPFVSVSDTQDFQDGPIGFPQVYPTTFPRPVVPVRPLGSSDNIHNHLIGAR